MTARALRTVGLVALTALVISQPIAFGAQAQGESQHGSTYPTELSGLELSAMIRSTFITVDNANNASNYSVLRDLSAQALKKNTMAEFQAIFSGLQMSQSDLVTTVAQDPRIVAATMTTPGALGVSGFFYMESELTTFRLLYRYEEGTWRIASMTVGRRAPFFTRDRSTGAIKPAEFSPALSVRLTPDNPSFPN